MQVKNAEKSTKGCPIPSKVLLIPLAFFVIFLVLSFIYFYPKSRFYDVVPSSSSRIIKTAGSKIENTEKWLRQLETDDSGVVVYRPVVAESYNNNASQDHRCHLVGGLRLIATYASHGMYQNQSTRSCRRAVSFDNIDACLQFTPKFIDEKFKKQNAAILGQFRGAGYWLWKPYILWRILLAMDENDVLLYLDADKILINNIEEFICVQAQVEEDVAVFYQEYPEYPWTKADAYHFMNVEDLPSVNDTMQIYGSYILLRKTLYSIRFVSEWLTYSQDNRINTDEPSHFRKNPSTFVENRNDQTVLSLLAKRWNIPSWPSPERAWNHTQIDNHNGVKFIPYNSLNVTDKNIKTPTKPIIGRHY